MHIYAGFRVESAELGVLQKASAAAAATAAAAAQKRTRLGFMMLLHALQIRRLLLAHGAGVLGLRANYMAWTKRIAGEHWLNPKP
jgi:hypothetical protein